MKFPNSIRPFWTEPGGFGVNFRARSAEEAGMTTPDTASDATASEGTVIVAESGSGTYTQRITAGRHELVSDEPQPIGSDAGPTPYDLLLAALGSCTSMTVRMYAKRRDWPLEQVRVTLRHSRIHAADCADCETRTGVVDHIDLGIELIGDLDEDQRQRLLLIAGRCPVHQTLTSEIDIATKLLDQGRKDGSPT
jgi:putative redox protein